MRREYVRLKSNYMAKLRQLGFTGIGIVCATNFYSKYAADTKDGKFPKAIPFSPENVIDVGISKSTFYRTMKFGEGKTWRLVQTGGGSFKNHYEAITDWQDMKLPTKYRKLELDRLIESTENHNDA